jgi:glycosyltransferase involved in cell wall biosynthesis
MLAGFDYVTGDCMVVMDADLQHPPELIPDMVKLWEEGYDDVYAKRVVRGRESRLRKRFSLLFYRILRLSARIDIQENVGDFRLLDRKCINALRQLRESERYTKGMFAWIGFRKREIFFEQSDRLAGRSSWGGLKLFNLAVNGITSFSVAPLRFSTVVGLGVFLIAFMYMCIILVRTLIYGETVRGYPTLITIILFLGGIQLFMMGIIGEYLGKVFSETKNRPPYIVCRHDGEVVDELKL